MFVVLTQDQCHRPLLLLIRMETIGPLLTESIWSDIHIFTLNIMGLYFLEL